MMELTGDAHGGALRQQIISGKPYPIKYLMAFGINHRMWPDSDLTLKALKKLDFFVNIELFLTDACKYADIVLPACTSVERSELKTYGGGYTILTSPAIEPLYESKSDADIVFELAQRLDIDDDLLKKGYEYNLDWTFEPSGFTVADLKKSQLGIMVPQTPVKYKRYEDEGFPTPSGKVECASEIIRERQPLCSPLPVYIPPGLSKEADPKLAGEYPLILNTGSRLPMFIHSETFRLPWARSLRPDPAADINPADAEALGLSQGDDILISTPKGRIRVKANITELALKGAVFMYHGYKEADVNTLIEADYLDPISGFPGFKSLLCRVEKADAEAEKTIVDAKHADADAENTENELFRVDPALCVGCYACAVACMDQNDIDPAVEDAPVFFGSQSRLKNFPNETLRHKTGRKTRDCEACRVRARSGLPPACVSVCPTHALTVTGL